MQRSRYYGLVGAGVFALGAGTLMTFLIIANRREPIPEAPDGPTPPDIRDALPNQATQGALAGKDLLVQMMDKDDPTRQSGELRAAVIDPTPIPGHYAVDKPQIWMFLDSGKTLFVRADSGQLVMPSRRQEPESGVLRGAVEIRIYDTIGVGDESTLGPPSLVAKTPMLTFDTTVPEMESPQPFTVEGRGIRFEGKSLRVLASQTRERLELVEVLGGGTLVYTPPKKSEARMSPGLQGTRHASGPRGEAGVFTTRGSASGSTVTLASYSQDGAAERSNEPDGKPGPTEPPNIVNYMTTFADTVTVQQGERRLEGDRLDVWARLVDGRLPEDAVGGSAPSEKDESAPTSGESKKPDAKPEQQPSQGAEVAKDPAPATSPDDQTVTMTWTGPMVARPVADDVRELESNHVHLRVTAEKRGVVTMADTATGAAGRCNVLDYAATTQDLGLSASGVSLATLQMPGQGRISATRIEQNLGSGIGYVAGAGLIEALSDEADSGNDPRRGMARWSDSATFMFEVEDGSMTDRIREAILLGDVNASSQGSSLAGDSVHAYFASGEGATPSLSRMRADGSVRTGDAKGNALESETLDVAFNAPTGSEGGEADPSVATAIGSVKVTSSAGDTVTAAFLEAELGRDAEGELGARTVRAEEWVEVNTAAGQRAITPKLVADVPGQVIDLIGAGSVASQSKDGLRTQVTGDSIRLFGLSRAIDVNSGGTFVHGPDATQIPGSRSSDTAPRTIDARWTQSMRFSDEQGTLEARGDVHAESTVGAFERHVLDADAISARIMPASDHERLAREAREQDLPTPERPVLFAEARVDPTLPSGGTESRVQAVYYARPSPEAALSGPVVETEPRIERLFQAQGATITADNQGGVVAIPGPGRFVVADLREPDASGSSDSSGAPGSMRGRTLFEWAGSMRFDRDPGVVRLTEQATMVQRRPDDGGVLNVNADELEARVRPASDAAAASTTAPGAEMELTGVTARRNVVVIERTGNPLTLNREVQAEILDYDTVRATAEATSPQGGLVTLFETSRGVPISAKSIFWDLARDRVEIRGMTTVTSPR